MISQNSSLVLQRKQSTVAHTSTTREGEGRHPARDMGSSDKAEKKAKKEKKDKKDKKATKPDAGKKGASKKGGTAAAAAQQPSGKAAKKKALLDWFHGALKDDTDDARADFLKARDYTAVANVIRKHARAPKHGGAHADAIKLLDNKGHFLNIVDVVVKDGAADAQTHWDKVKAHHRVTTTTSVTITENSRRR